MEYAIVKANRTDLLETFINERIKAGWVPQGGVSVAVAQDQGYETVVYTQAMIKESK